MYNVSVLLQGQLGTFFNDQRRIENLDGLQRIVLAAGEEFKGTSLVRVKVTNPNGETVVDLSRKEYVQLVVNADNHPMAGLFTGMFG